MIRLRAPAKLNLYLRVLGRRPDGYHEIETVFERIDLADELAFEPRPHELRLTCSDASAVPAGGGLEGPGLSCGDDNLILKAARVLQRETGTSRGASIHLTKRIPIAAGLGGGSSDAAAALVGLNALWELGLGRAELSRVASALGSDVPFFLLDAPFALGRGRGDVCEAVPCAGRLAHVLLAPAARVATEDIYQGSSFTLTARRPSSTMVLHALRNGSPSELATGLWNDLAPEAIRRCPVISLCQLHLRDEGCLASCLSGSGPSVFGLCRDAPHAQVVAQRLRGRLAQPCRIEIIQTDDPARVVTSPVRAGS